MTTDIRELVERLERAGERSQELDVAIAKVAGQPYGPLSEVMDDGKEIWHHAECAAHYTTSLDAALTLVPEGWAYILYGEAYGDEPCAELYKPQHPPKGIQHRKRAATPALALCIAALKASDA